mgnify:CR=1 FL=1
MNQVAQGQSPDLALAQMGTVFGADQDLFRVRPDPCNLNLDTNPVYKQFLLW